MLIREARGYINRGTVYCWYSLEAGSWLNTHKKEICKYNNIFEFFCRTGAPTKVEDGNFRLSTRFLDHCSVASPPTNQNKGTHPAVFTANVAFCFWGQ